MQRQNSRRPYRVVVHGLADFCQKLPGLLGSETWYVRDYSKHLVSDIPAFVSDLRRCDLIYTWGGRISFGKFLSAARFLARGKLIMLWCGSDVLFARKQLATRTIEPWVAEKIHWAVSPTLAQEVRSLGLPCEYVQASFVEPVARPKPLPEKFSVLVYSPSVKKGYLYGLDQILEIADSLRFIEFNLVGLEQGHISHAPPNFKVHAHVPITPFLEKSTVIWRPVRHDGGISFLVLEALAHGRHVLYSYPFPACIQARDKEAARRELRRLHLLHEAGGLRLNEDGIQTVARDYTRDKVRSNLLHRWEEIILRPSSGIGELSSRADHRMLSRPDSSGSND